MSTTAPNESLKELASLLGDEATREIVQLFLQDFPDSIRSLASCGRDDQQRIVHGLRNSALHMGAERLTRQLAAIEERLGRPDRPGDPVTGEELAAATAEFDAFAGDLRRYAAG